MGKILRFIYKKLITAKKKQKKFEKKNFTEEVAFVIVRRCFVWESEIRVVNTSFTLFLSIVSKYSKI